TSGLRVRWVRRTPPLRAAAGVNGAELTQPLATAAAHSPPVTPGRPAPSVTAEPAVWVVVSRPAPRAAASTPPADPRAAVSTPADANETGLQNRTKEHDHATKVTLPAIVADIAGSAAGAFGRIFRCLGPAAHFRDTAGSRAGPIGGGGGE